MSVNPNPKVRDGVRIAIACSATFGFLFTGRALAADQSQATSSSTTNSTTAAQTQLKAVEVTGTRIKRTSVEQAQPIQVITKAQIKASGFTTIGQVLQNITSVGDSLNTQQDNGGNSTTTSAGQTTLNLRSLGSQRTLVLVNGHRWVTDLNGSVDLNTIPTSIIDHVEILQDGASAIYGSDAIAGVVNIITIKNFNGAEANAYMGIHQGDGHWDGQVKNYNATLGFGGDHGGLLLSASYEDEEAVPSMNRTLSSQPIFGTGTTRGSATTPQGTVQFIAPYGGSTTTPDNFPAPSTGLTSTQCPAQNFGSQAAPNYLPFCYLTTIAGTNGTAPSDFKPFTPTDNYNFQQGILLLTPDQRFSLYAAGHYDLAQNLTWNIEAATSQRHSKQSAAPGDIVISSSTVANLPANQDYNPFNFALSTTAPIGPGLLLRLAQRSVAAGDRVNTEDENLVHVRSGFTGFFDAAGSEWDWDAGYMFSKDTEVDNLFGTFDGNRLSVQLGPPAGCAAQASLGCVPINLFGGQANPPTPEQFAYSLYVDRYTYARNSRGVYADISNSDLADLPAGPIGLAAGYQYLGNSGAYQPSAIDLQQPNPPAPTAGSTSINAEYLEIDIPLLANLPFAKVVDLDVASRRTEAQANKGHSEYNTSSRAGLKWQPTDDLLLRGSWSQGFRAPDISELFAGRQSSSSNIADPCSSYLTTGVPTTVQQRCAASGVPASYVQTLNQLGTQEQGNPDLKPETSISRSVGFVYSPDWLPGFNMNADYFKIELEGTIQPIGGANILDGCYFGGITGDCDRIFRQSNGTGIIRVINDSVANIGGTLTSGADVGFSYDFQPTTVGQFKLSVQGTYTRQYDQYFPTANGESVTTLSLVGIERGAQSTPSGIPRWKAMANLAWNLGSWNASWRMQYIGPMMEQCSDYLDNTPFSFTNLGVCSQPNLGNNALSMNRLAATVYHNAQIGYTYDPWNTSFTFGVNNVFNKRPPESVTTTVNSFDTSNYPIPGRFFYASVGIKF